MHLNETWQERLYDDGANFDRTKWPLLMAVQVKNMRSGSMWDPAHGRVLVELALLSGAFLMEHWSWLRARNTLMRYEVYLSGQYKSTHHQKTREALSVCWCACARPIIAVALRHHADKAILEALVAHSVFLHRDIFTVRSPRPMARPPVTFGIVSLVSAHAPVTLRPLPPCIAHPEVHDEFKAFETQELPALRNMLSDPRSLDRRTQAFDTLELFVRNLVRRALSVEDVSTQCALFTSIIATCEERIPGLRAKRSAHTSLMYLIDRALALGKEVYPNLVRAFV